MTRPISFPYGAGASRYSFQVFAAGHLYQSEGDYLIHKWPRKRILGRQDAAIRVLHDFLLVPHRALWFALLFLNVRSIPAPQSSVVKCVAPSEGGQAARHPESARALGISDSSDGRSVVIGSSS